MILQVSTWMSPEVSKWLVDGLFHLLHKWGFLGVITHLPTPHQNTLEFFLPVSEAEIPIEQRGDEEVKYAEAKRKVFGGMVFEEGGLWVECRIQKYDLRLMTYDYILQIF